nr:restriction endonuclease subunit S [Chloroflexota bacterium]
MRESADQNIEPTAHAGGWRNVQLGEVLTLQRGFDLPTQDREPGDVPIVSSSGISGQHSKAKVAGPGVVTGRYGTIGRVYYIREDFWPLNTTLYVKDFKGNDPLFVSYLLRTIDFHAHNDKSSVPGVNRNHLHTVPVRVPPLPEQRAIAAILGALDDKIELNRRMNRTLEAMARAIFASWFVDFDPVRAKMEGRQPFGMDADTAALFPHAFEDSPLGQIPRGWQVGRFSDSIELLSGG